LHSALRSIMKKSNATRSIAFGGEAQWRARSQIPAPQ